MSGSVAFNKISNYIWQSSYLSEVSLLNTHILHSHLPWRLVMPTNHSLQKPPQAKQPQKEKSRTSFDILVQVFTENLRFILFGLMAPIASSIIYIATHSIVAVFFTIATMMIIIYYPVVKSGINHSKTFHLNMQFWKSIFSIDMEVDNGKISTNTTEQKDERK